MRKGSLKNFTLMGLIEGKMDDGRQQDTYLKRLLINWRLRNVGFVMPGRILQDRNFLTIPFLLHDLKHCCKDLFSLVFL